MMTQHNSSKGAGTEVGDAFYIKGPEGHNLALDSNNIIYLSNTKKWLATRVFTQKQNNLNS